MRTTHTARGTKRCARRSRRGGRRSRRARSSSSAAAWARRPRRSGSISTCPSSRRGTATPTRRSTRSHRLPQPVHVQARAARRRPRRRRPRAHGRRPRLPRIGARRLRVRRPLRTQSGAAWLLGGGALSSSPPSPASTRSSSSRTATTSAAAEGRGFSLVQCVSHLSFQAVWRSKVLFGGVLHVVDLGTDALTLLTFVQLAQWHYAAASISFLAFAAVAQYVYTTMEHTPLLRPEIGDTIRMKIGAKKLGRVVALDLDAKKAAEAERAQAELEAEAAEKAEAASAAAAAPVGIRAWFRRGGSRRLRRRRRRPGPGRREGRRGRRCHAASRRVRVERIPVPRRGRGGQSDHALPAQARHPPRRALARRARGHDAALRRGVWPRDVGGDARVDPAARQVGLRRRVQGGVG